ncbi:MAG TPA: hypothetical protein VEI02_03960 [Planctomycetota bacterium]|nr:hypothetical protein [Planctomycetota bacterium]
MHGFLPLVLAVAAFAVAAPGQSLTLHAQTDPAVHGSFHILQHATQDAFYLASSPAFSGVQTLTRWRPAEGFTILGVTPIANYFDSACEGGGFVWFGGDGGVWRAPSSGVGLTLWSTSWPSTFSGPATDVSFGGGATWFQSGGRLGSVNAATGAVIDHGAPLGATVARVAADGGAVCCLAAYPSGAWGAFRYEPAFGVFSLLTWFVPNAIAGPARPVLDGGELAFLAQGAWPGGALHGLVRLDAAGGNLHEMTALPEAFSFLRGFRAAGGGAYDWIAQDFPMQFVARRTAAGISALTPPPCLLEPTGFFPLCDVVAHFPQGGVVRLLAAPAGADGFVVATYDPAPVAAATAVVTSGCAFPGAPTLTSTTPALGAWAGLTVAGAPSTFGYLVGGAPPSFPLSLGGCAVLVDLNGATLLPFLTNGAGVWTGAVATPPDVLIFYGLKFRWQAATFAAGLALTDAVEWTFGG